MQVRFSLKIKNALVEGVEIDYFMLEWKEELTPIQLAKQFNSWLGDYSFIKKRFPDLQDAAFCQLFINPQQ